MDTSIRRTTDVLESSVDTCEVLNVTANYDLRKKNCCMLLLLTPEVQLTALFLLAEYIQYKWKLNQSLTHSKKITWRWQPNSIAIQNSYFLVFLAELQISPLFFPCFFLYAAGFSFLIAGQSILADFSSHYDHYCHIDLLWRQLWGFYTEDNPNHNQHLDLLSFQSLRMLQYSSWFPTTGLHSVNRAFQVKNNL